MARGHKEERSAKKQGYYQRQFSRTEINKARRASKRARKKKKWANDRLLSDWNFVRLLRKHDRRIAKRNVRRMAWRAKMKALKEERAKAKEQAKVKQHENRNES